MRRGRIVDLEEEIVGPRYIAAVPRANIRFLRPNYKTPSAAIKVDLTVCAGRRSPAHETDQLPIVNGIVALFVPHSIRRTCVLPTLSTENVTCSTGALVLPSFMGTRPISSFG